MTPKLLIIITAAQVAKFAKMICGADYHCYDIGKVESALHSAFYPGLYPYEHGGVAMIAGAMTFYCKRPISPS